MAERISNSGLESRRFLCGWMFSICYIVLINDIRFDQRSNRTNVLRWHASIGLGYSAALQGQVSSCYCCLLLERINGIIGYVAQLGYVSPVKHSISVLITYKSSSPDSPSFAKKIIKGEKSGGGSATKWRTSRKRSSKSGWRRVGVFE